MPTQRGKNDSPCPRLEPSTKVSIYNERVRSEGGHRKKRGQREHSRGRRLGPWPPPLKGPKPNSRVLSGPLSLRKGQSPQEGEGRRWGMGWGVGCRWGGWVGGGDGGEAASAPRLPPPLPRPTHTFPWDEHRKG